MINCILLLLLMLLSMVLLKCTNSHLVIHFLNFIPLFHLQVLLIIILLVSFVIFFHLKFLMITLAKILFLLFLKLRMQIFFKIILVSYNVTSLFTNIPLQETIDIAITLIFNHNSSLNISKKELKKLFLLATSQTHFTFNSKFYNQIDGVAMGSTLAPVLVNILMGFHESKWFNEYNLNKPKYFI